MKKTIKLADIQAEVAEAHAKVRRSHRSRGHKLYFRYRIYFQSTHSHTRTTPIRSRRAIEKDRG